MELHILDLVNQNAKILILKGTVNQDAKILILKGT